ncbi:hypothetical protein D9M69_630330 [compost metagenome]
MRQQHLKLRRIPGVVLVRQCDPCRFGRNVLKDTFKVAVEPQPLFEPKYPKPLVAAEFAVHEVANFGETPVGSNEALEL